MNGCVNGGFIIWFKQECDGGALGVFYASELGLRRRGYFRCCNQMDKG